MQADIARLTDAELPFGFCGELEHAMNIKFNLRVKLNVQHPITENGRHDAGALQHAAKYHRLHENSYVIRRISEAILDFFGNLSWFLQGFLLPDYGILAYPGNVISFIAEISLMLWLLIIGVKEQK